MSEKKSGELKIKVRDEILGGVYANTLIVSHTAEEFVLDFVLALPPQGAVNSRVIVSPGHLKRIIGALQQNLARYEERNGVVAEAPDPGKGGAGIVH
jgi:hypothetical protein